ncbi:hypothetical protein P170DRAFT_471931 [Aspergillus steynii IBT 23096]|uniref:Zn(2)-C6 fungal-type domain-containing protein n=1 Tax=Aspergillus steynii IBT 23096 TaxID=1392250 RepID=A0A2I2GGK7_9EURO|nr:uncharacterized protein P170DRAFT_471931 [Aspergillus steynii IBT 23096]PLB52018.1 hypothetical protein P170DRAFT_471931 [Aspergillus steynii IBT 23096]
MVKRSLLDHSNSRHSKRSRGTTACHACRARKTRCDNARPVCGFCVERQAHCVYPDTLPAHPEIDPTSKEILQQLSHITTLLEKNTQYGHSDADSRSFLADIAPNEMPEYSQLFFCAPEAILKWPVFKGIVTEADSSIHSILLESQEKNNKRDLESHFDCLDGDFVGPCIAFLSSANRRNPIVDAEDLKRFAHQLLACALSHLSIPSQNKFILDEPDACPPPEKHVAEAYFNEAKKRLGMLHTSLVDIQCLFLASIYEKHAIRPLQAWFCIQQASSRLKVRLSSRQASLDSVDRHLEQRLYWSLIRAEREFQLEVPLGSSGLEDCRYPDPFPMPPFNQSTPAASSSTIDEAGQGEASDISAKIEEERGWFFYLAEISFRRIFDSIVVLLYQGGPRRWPSNFTRLVRQCKDSDEQISLWFAHLPPPIRPTSPPTNDLSFFLHGRYLSSREKICRPLVYVILHHPSLLDAKSSEEVQEMLSLAQQGIDFCAVLIPHYSAHFRHGGTWFILRASFKAALLILVVVVGRFGDGAAPALYLQPPDDWIGLVKLSLKTLRKWEDESKDVERMRIILEGILDRVSRITT